MEKKEQIRAYCRQFKTAGINNSLEEIIQNAENHKMGFMEFTLQLLEAERRPQRDAETEDTEEQRPADGVHLGVPARLVPG